MELWSRFWDLETGNIQINGMAANPAWIQKFEIGHQARIDVDDCSLKVVSS